MNRVSVGPATVLGWMMLLVSRFLMAQSAPVPEDLSTQFGALRWVQSAELSPDGKRVAFIAPAKGTANMLLVLDLQNRKLSPVAKADGEPMRLSHCGWVAQDRLVCREYGLVRDPVRKVTSYSRMIAVDVDGKNMVAMGTRNTAFSLYERQFDGSIVDWLEGTDGKVIMERQYVPEMSTGRRTAQTDEGWGVDLIDTRTQKTVVIERAKPNTHFMSDGRGVIRLMTSYSIGGGSSSLLTGKMTHFYRLPDDREWHELGVNDNNNSGIDPVAVDSGVNAAYVLKQLNSRRALYRILLDGSMKTELVFEHPQVDVDDVVTIGRKGRVIGARYATEIPHVEYFDPTYSKLAASLAAALPKLPLIAFVGASADEQVLLIHASSDSDPGRYYVFDRSANRLSDVMHGRPELDGIALAQAKDVRYPAADGTVVPAYLTLPPGVNNPANLPAVVMPHGGPASRDVWGFDWLAQFYALRGFAVLQPNFRGSAGYGNEWFVQNGFRSWKMAINDINDGAKWLVKQGVADPARLTIVGWSYGGYAALQANVLEPDLYKAAIAIAPVTDLDMLKAESDGYTNQLVIKDFIGTGAHLEAGSPARHAAEFKAPVLIFHGELDANVDVAESRAMDRGLRQAGKQSELIVYPRLDHQLPDATARADMLRRSYDFLKANLKLQ